MPNVVRLCLLSTLLLFSRFLPLVEMAIYNYTKQLIFTINK